MINNIIDLLHEILKEIEKNNPYYLIGKGGTILSIYHLGHRDSQDLDFDCPIEYKDKDFHGYFLNIFMQLMNKKLFNKFEINKKELSGTNRFHMSITFFTHKQLPQTKIDINFIAEQPKNLLSQGNFKFYDLNQLFIHKVETYIRREEIRDIIDIGTAVIKLDYKNFPDETNFSKDLEIAIQKIESLKNNPRQWRDWFDSINLKFYIVNKKNFQNFLDKTSRELFKFKNQLEKKV
jgi:predicted nucleotidyltransferase component of viral defense system